MVVPGDGSIRIHIQLWDEEAVGSTSNLKDATSAAAQAAIAAGMTAINPILGGSGAIVAAVSGILSSVGDAIGDAVADIIEEAVGDDLIDQLDFVVPSTFLKEVCFGNPASLNRMSAAIPGVMFNFPDTVEDDSWLFERGHGTYRVFFRILKV